MSVQTNSRTSLKILHLSINHIKLAIAFTIAPIFWAFFYLFTHQVSNLTWPIAFPREYLTQAMLLPVLEEIVFRKILQGHLYELPWGQKSWCGISNANILVSILFGCFHLIYHSYVWAIAVILPSLIFGYFRDCYRLIKPSIALHIFYNAGYFWLFGRVESH